MHAPVFVLTSWPDFMKGLAAGRFDLAAGGVSWTPERARITTALPRYAPFGKVALIRRAAAERFQTPEDLNQPGVRVIKNPGGTNERWVDEHLTRAQVSTVADNASIPARIANDLGDVMITDSFEALWYSARDVRLTVAMEGRRLTPIAWKTMLLRLGARRPVLPGRESSPAASEPLGPLLLSAWGRLERAGVVETLAAKWLGAGRRAKPFSAAANTASSRSFPSAGFP